MHCSLLEGHFVLQAAYGTLEPSFQLLSVADLT